MRAPVLTTSATGDDGSWPRAARSLVQPVVGSVVRAARARVRVDLALAAVVLVQGAVELVLAGRDGGLPGAEAAVQSVYLAGIAVAVLLRTTSAEWSAGIYLLSTVMVCTVSRPAELLAVGLAFTVLPFLYAISLDGTRFVIVLGTLLVAIAVRSLDDPGEDWFAKLLDQVWVLQSAAAGLVVRRYRRRADRLGDAAAERARDAVELERARIARELHDVVGHQVTAMIVTADAARGALEDALGRAGSAAAPPDGGGAMAEDPEAGRAAIEALAAIEATGRQCLAEMRQLVGLLRQGIDGSAEADGGAVAAPGGLDALDDLIRRTRAAGLPVRRETVGAPVGVPTATGLAVYRVVQEALTNTLRHAGPAQAVVRLVWADDALTVHVEDVAAEPRAHAPTAHTIGAGLIGLRERVRLFGGTFYAGPADAGTDPGDGAKKGTGWVVRAAFPVPAAWPPAPPSAARDAARPKGGT